MCHVTMTLTSVHRYINYQKMSKGIGLVRLNVNWNEKKRLPHQSGDANYITVYLLSQVFTLC